MAILAGKPGERLIDQATMQVIGTFDAEGKLNDTAIGADMLVKLKARVAAQYPVGRAVTFTVTGAESAALAGAVIEVADTAVTTDAEGKAVLYLGAGTYDVTVRCAGYDTATDTVTVAASAVSKAVALTLEA